MVAVLTEQETTRGASTYWAVLKKRLKDEGVDQLLTNCKQLKLKSEKDGKRYKTDVANTEQLAALYENFQNAEIDFLIRPFALPEKSGVFILLPPGIRR